MPKSTSEERIRENADIFDFSLDAEAMKMLDALEDGRAVAWDPRNQK